MDKANRHPPRRPRAASSGIRLSREDAAIVKGMLNRGDRQSAIAAYFRGINQGRIAEISTEQKFSDVEPAPPEKLPPRMN
jgi:hypothetical protein